MGWGVSDSYKWLAKPLWDSRPDVDCWEVVDADGGSVFFGGFDDVFTGKRQALLVASAPELLEALGLARQLSPTRLNGLANVRRTIREFAAAHSA